MVNYTFSLCIKNHPTSFSLLFLTKASFPGNFPGIDHSLDHLPHQQLMEPLIIGETSGDNSNQMVDYMPNNPQNHHHHHTSFGFPGSNSDLHKLSFADDGIQFADFGPKLALNRTEISQDETGLVDPVYFLKFPVLNDKLVDEPLMGLPPPPPHPQGVGENIEDGFREEKGDNKREDGEGRGLEKTNSVQLGIVLGENLQKSKRKRQRSMKTSEEAESQRMTHIAVERNRRKQMNEHLRVLRSLMPGSYVQRGDQASIVGGAIEFVRELEQLLQCLESQKRRRLYGGGDSSLATTQPHNQQPFLPNDHHQLIRPVEYFESGLEEETAESKTCLADVEVKMLGFDAMIKILSRRRPAQLINTIAALEDLHLTIVHTNITTIEQTVLYSFNVKVASEGRFTAEDIASSVQQIFSYIHANSSI